MFTKDDILRFEKLETPFYFYSLEILEQTLKVIKEVSSNYNYHVHYAFKANTNDHVLKLIQAYGLGADCVSGNEVKKALEYSFSKDKIVFAGVGKSDKEINLALDNDIFSFNCESIQELEVINELAEFKQKNARVALRINPNVMANTHRYITTGLEENKFGISLWELEAVVEKLEQLNNLELIGLHFHIGSQITDLTAFKSLCIRVNEIQEWFQNRNIPLKHINVGGGLGVDYHKPDENKIPDFETFFKIFDDFLELKPHQELHFELGRSVVAQCGALISKVLYIKNGIKTDFAILDAGMTELLRPALYQAYHKIDSLTSEAKELQKYDVVGPICESSDCFGKAIELPEIKRGDLLAIRSAGAYGEVMALNYNLRDDVKAYYK
jgi:diaminopimelate decarboxylase